MAQADPSYRWFSWAPYVATAVVAIATIVAYAGASRGAVDRCVILSLIAVALAWLLAIIVLIWAPRGSGRLRVASAIGMLVSLLSLAPMLFLAAVAHGPMPGA